MKAREEGIGQHLIELRRRILISGIVLVLGAGVAFYFHKEILGILVDPHPGFASTPGGKPIFTNLTEFIGITMKVSLMGGLILALPVIVYQGIMFVAPGLTRTEKRYLYIMLPFTLISFAGGAAFGYLIIFPPMVGFLLDFGSDVATPMIRIGQFVGLMITLIFWMGIIFEIPLLMFFLSKIGLVTPKVLARQRRLAIVVAFILGAVITPTFDPINQSLVAMPIILLYELGVWLAKIARWGRVKSQNGT